MDWADSWFEPIALSVSVSPPSLCVSVRNTLKHSMTAVSFGIG